MLVILLDQRFSGQVPYPGASTAAAGMGKEHPVPTAMHPQEKSLPASESRQAARASGKGPLQGEGYSSHSLLASLGGIHGCHPGYGAKGQRSNGMEQSPWTGQPSHLPTLPVRPCPGVHGVAYGIPGASPKNLSRSACLILRAVLARASRH